MEYKIEKNVEMPEKKGRKKYPFEKMSVGDSFIISENYSRQEMITKGNTARNWARYKGLDWKFAVRKTGGNKIRIWRIK